MDAPNPLTHSYINVLFRTNSQVQPDKIDTDPCTIYELPYRKTNICQRFLSFVL